eukprot:7267579-Alexandrium_andersonii.AAC.1
MATMSTALNPARTSRPCTTHPRVHRLITADWSTTPPTRAPSICKPNVFAHERIHVCLHARAH